METLTVVSGQARSCITLKNFITGLLDRFQPLAVKKRSFIVNDVRPEFEVTTDLILLENILTRMFETIIGQCEDCCIRVTAKNFHNVVLFRISNLKGFQGMKLLESLSEINQLAEKLGGCITYNNQRLKESTFVLSFFSYMKAA